MHSWKQVAYSTDKLDDLIDHRQHFPYGSLPIINQMTFNLPMPKVGANYWTEFIYFSQISQAMSTKTETETYRYGLFYTRMKCIQNDKNWTLSLCRIGRYFDWHTMGALYWQLNDVWIAPSWSSIEYNGNFKVLQYWAKEFFAPLHVVANVDAMKYLNVFVVRDTLGEAQQLSVRVRTFKWSSFNPVSDFNIDVSMVSYFMPYFHKVEFSTINRLQAQNSADRVLQKPLKEVLTNGATEKNSLLHFALTDKTSGEIVATNFLLLDKIKKSEEIVNPNLQVHL